MAEEYTVAMETKKADLLQHAHTCVCVCVCDCLHVMKTTHAALSQTHTHFHHVCPLQECCLSNVQRCKYVFKLMAGGPRSHAGTKSSQLSSLQDESETRCNQHSRHTQGSCSKKTVGISRVIMKTTDYMMPNHLIAFVPPLLKLLNVISNHGGEDEDGEEIPSSCPLLYSKAPPQQEVHPSDICLHHTFVQLRCFCC